MPPVVTPVEYKSFYIFQAIVRGTLCLSSLPPSLYTIPSLQGSEGRFDEPPLLWRFLAAQNQETHASKLRAFSSVFGGGSIHFCGNALHQADNLVNTEGSLPSTITTCGISVCSRT